MPTPVVISNGVPVRVVSSREAAYREAVNELTRAVEDATWTRLDDDPRRDDAPYEERRALIERSRRFIRRHPLAKQATKLLVNYVLGQGISLRANDKQHIARIVDEFWEDPINRAVLTSHDSLADAVRSCFSDGGLFIVLFPDTEEGKVHVGLLDALFVEDIVSDPENWRVPKWYKVRKPEGKYDYTTGAWIPSTKHEFVWYRDWHNEDPTPEAPQKEPGRRRKHAFDGPTSDTVQKGVVLHIAINRRGLFGEPEPAAALDWIVAHKGFMEDRATINRAAATIAWRTKQKGSVASVQAEAARLRSTLTRSEMGWDRNPPPATGSHLIENQNSDTEWMRTDTGGAAATNDERLLRMLVGAGMGGIPNHIFGDEAQANLATATAMGTPMHKSYEQWQKLLGDMLTDIIGFVLETAHKAGRIGPRDDTDKYDDRKPNANEVLNRPATAPKQPDEKSLGTGPQPRLLGSGLKEHGDPSRPDYFKMHPNSKAVGHVDGGVAQPGTKRGAPSVTRDDEHTPTDKRFIGDDGNWLPERKQIHEDYVRQIQNGVPVTDEPIVYMTGGGPASGKGTWLKQRDKYGVPTDGVVYVNPDDAKKLLPEYPKAVAEGYKYASGMVQEESSAMTKAGLYDSLRNGHSVLYDVVGDSGIDKLEKKVQDMRDAGPGKTRIFADYMTVPVEMALQRAVERAKSPGEDKGRFIAPAVIRAMYKDIPGTVNEAIKRNVFDRLRVWDTNVPEGTPPRLIATHENGALTVNDQALWDAFIGGKRAKVTKVQEHGDPSMPNYARDYHPGPKGENRYTINRGDAALKLNTGSAWSTGPLEGDGVWATAEPDQAGNPDAAAKIAAKERDFIRNGGRIHEVKSMTDAELGLMRITDMKGEMPDDWFDGVGTRFTRVALEQRRYGESVLLAHDGDGIAGALSFNDSNDHVYLDVLGTTGITDGTGSALFANALRIAAGMNKGIRLDPISTAMPFWTTMGTHPIKGGEQGIWGLTAEEVADLEKGLSGGNA